MFVEYQRVARLERWRDCHASARLAPHSYRITDDSLPTRAVVRDTEGRQVDLHPIRFDEAGTGWQVGARPDGGDCEYPIDGFTYGRVGEMVVGCLSPHVQLAHHLGYIPRAHDRDDMARLAARFAIELPASYVNSS